MIAEENKKEKKIILKLFKNILGKTKEEMTQMAKEYGLKEELTEDLEKIIQEDYNHLFSN